MSHARALPLTLIFLAGGLSPARAELPPLIPRDVLFGDPGKVAVKLSPDGARISYLANAVDTNVLNIWVEPLDGGEPVMVTADTRRGIFEYGWAPDNLHLFYIQDRDGDENWHVYAANLETREARDLTPFEGVRAQNILTDPNHPREILVGLNKRDPSTFDMYRIDIVSGDVTLEVENPGDVDNWTTDTRFRIRGATALDAENNDTILRVRDAETGKWRDAVRWSFDDVGSVLYEKFLGFTPDGAGLIVQSPIGSEMTRLVVLDAATGNETRELAADPKSDVWNVWWVPQVVFNPRTHVVEAVGFNYLKPRWEVLDPAVREDFQKLEQAGEGMFHVTDRDLSDTKWLVTYYSDVSPDRYFLYDRTTGDLKHLFNAVPGLEGYTLAPVTAGVFTARDGMQIPYYLTLPVGVEPLGLLLVLLPHGGPWADDQWEFDPMVQILANRGYAALQVNFRGSTGYGKKHLNAGNNQWGVGSMQHDLTDAVGWAVDRGIADPERIGIMGGSYGGYATLCGLAFTPDLYACGVDMVGPSDVAALFKSFPPYWAVRKVRWIRRVGDVEHDDALNRRISPVYHAADIKAPLLIAHGANDPRVMQSASDTIVAAMRKNNLSVQYVVYPDEGHGLARPDNNLDFMGRVEEFLAEHLDGRKQPWVEIQGSSAEVR